MIIDAETGSILVQLVLVCMTNVSFSKVAPKKETKEQLKEYLDAFRPLIN